jgi:hypothetical protein
VASAYNFRGIIATEFGRKDEAITFFRAAMKIDAWSPAINQNFAVSLYRLGEVNEAVRMTIEFLQAHPDDLEFLKNSHDLLHRCCSYQATLDVIEKITKLGGEVDVGVEHACKFMVNEGLSDEDAVALADIAAKVVAARGFLPMHFHQSLPLEDAGGLTIAIRGNATDVAMCTIAVCDALAERAEMVYRPFFAISCVQAVDEHQPLATV